MFVELLAAGRGAARVGLDRALAQKRGAGAIVSHDAARAEARYAAEPVDTLSQWRSFNGTASMVLDPATGKLRTRRIRSRR